MGPYDLARSPAGGTNGSMISVTGGCDRAEVDVSLQRRTFPPDLFPPDAVVPFTTVGGRFSVSVTNVYGSEPGGGQPTDAELVVRCGDMPYEPRLNFHATDLGTTNSPTVFTAPGTGSCGTTPQFQPCPALVKGLDGRSRVYSDFEVASWQGGASIAVGDINGDGQADVVTGTPPGLLPVFVASRADGSREIASFDFVYGMFTGGVNVAVGDVTGDGRDDVVTGAGAGGGPHVKVFSFDPTAQDFVEVGGFYAYDPGFRGGVHVGVGDVDGDGHDEIITGAGPGGGPHVRVFRADGTPVGGTGFYAYDPAFAGGVVVAAGNLVGDGRAEIVTGAGPSGGPHVKVFDAVGNTLRGFYAYDEWYAGGVSVAVGHAMGPGGAPQIVTGAGPPASDLVTVRNADGSLISSWFPYYTSGEGANVAAVP
jgi:hypothetical protein